MRFTENGPTIPDDLLIARDAGDVVFFCGAGVSMAYAGLTELISTRLLRDREEAFSEETRRGWRLLMEAWSDRRPDPDTTAARLSRQAKREGLSTRLVREYAALFRPRIKIDTLGRWRLRHPLLWTAGTCTERIVSAGVEYTHPHAELDVSDELIAFSVRLFRSNLELAESLEHETGRNQLYITTTYENSGGNGRRSDASNCV